MRRSQGLIRGGRTTWTRYRIVEREPELGDTVLQKGVWEPGFVVELADDNLRYQEAGSLQGGERVRLLADGRPCHVCEYEGSMFLVPKDEAVVVEPDRWINQAARRQRDYAAACGRITERMEG